MKTKIKKHLPLVLRIVTAFILIQTLRYKFTGHPDSVYIFSTIGMEPYGRIGIGILELIAAILLILPRTIWIGALLTLGVIGGAILTHLTILGIEVRNDGGTLFGMALLTFIFSGIILVIYRSQIPIIKSQFLKMI